MQLFCFCILWSHCFNAFVKICGLFFIYCILFYMNFVCWCVGLHVVGFIMRLAFYWSITESESCVFPFIVIVIVVSPVHDDILGNS